MQAGERAEAARNVDGLQEAMAREDKITLLYTVPEHVDPDEQKQAQEALLDLARLLRQQAARKYLTALAAEEKSNKLSEDINVSNIATKRRLSRQAQ
jgi:hypothetical protein